MPSQRYFDQCPSFPGDVPTADLPVISLAELEHASAQESFKLYDACRHHGFFLLDLHHSELGQALLQDGEGMFDLTVETLNLSREILDRYAYHPPKDLLGYKASGKLKTDDGKLNATEMYTLGQDDMLGTATARQNPEPIERHRPGCRDFFTRAHAAVAIILGALDTQLGLPGGTLARLASPERASATSLRLLLTRPQATSVSAPTPPPAPTRVTLGAHTDIGLITLLLHVAGGLQILPAGCDNVDGNWRYVRPKIGCALINLGDTLVEWTGGLLRSSLHRVVAAPGGQAAATRVGLAYLVRPARGESMRRLSGKNIPQPAEGEEEDNRNEATKRGLARLVNIALVAGLI